MLKKKKASVPKPRWSNKKNKTWSPGTAKRMGFNPDDEGGGSQKPVSSSLRVRKFSPKRTIRAVHTLTVDESLASSSATTTAEKDDESLVPNSCTVRDDDNNSDGDDDDDGVAKPTTSLYFVPYVSESAPTSSPSSTGSSKDEITADDQLIMTIPTRPVGDEEIEQSEQPDPDDHGCMFKIVRGCKSADSSPRLSLRRGRGNGIKSANSSPKQSIRRLKLSNRPPSSPTHKQRETRRPLPAETAGEGEGGGGGKRRSSSTEKLELEKFRKRMLQRQNKAGRKRLTGEQRDERCSDPSWDDHDDDRPRFKFRRSPQPPPRPKGPKRLNLSPGCMSSSASSTHNSRVPSPDGGGEVEPRKESSPKSNRRDIVPEREPEPSNSIRERELEPEPTEFIHPVVQVRSRSSSKRTQFIPPVSPARNHRFGWSPPDGGGGGEVEPRKESSPKSNRSDIVTERESEPEPTAYKHSVLQVRSRSSSRRTQFIPPASPATRNHLMMNSSASRPHRISQTSRSPPAAAIPTG